MTRQEQINRLRMKLLALGQPVIIPGSELPQPLTASQPMPMDIILYRYQGASK